MIKLFKLPGVWSLINSGNIRLDKAPNDEMLTYIISKLDSSTYSNVVTQENEEDAVALWNDIEAHFASSQSAN